MEEAAAAERMLSNKLLDWFAGHTRRIVVPHPFYATVNKLQQQGKYH